MSAVLIPSLIAVTDSRTLRCVVLEQAAVTRQPGQPQKERPRQLGRFWGFFRWDQPERCSQIEICKANTPTGCLEERICIVSKSDVLNCWRAWKQISSWAEFSLQSGTSSQAIAFSVFVVYFYFAGLFLLRAVLKIWKNRRFWWVNQTANTGDLFSFNRAREALADEDRKYLFKIE